MEWEGVESDDEVVRFEVRHTMRRQGGVKGDYCIMRRKTSKVRPNKHHGGDGNGSITH
jgi:hypothetical protein